MGEYFAWINVDKMEYIRPIDFDYGSKFHETLHKDSVPLLALHTLLDERWAGDHMVFLGDECIVPEDPHNYVYDLLNRQNNAAPGCGCSRDLVDDTYHNVSGLFRESEDEVRQRIGYYLEDLKNHEEYAHNDYGIDINDPFKGLFVLTGRRRRYVLNHTRQICYSLEETRILYLDHTESDFADPLPILLGFGRSIDPGPWIGDAIGVSEEIPKGYSLLQEIYLNW